MSDIILSEPARLWFAGACGLVALLAGLAVGQRHPRWSRVVSGAGRLAALALVGVVLASPSVEATSEKRFQPQGEWFLQLTGQQQLRREHYYIETPEDFAARVRKALAEGRPPARVVVNGLYDEANYARGLMDAMGIPCEVHYYKEMTGEQSLLGEIRGPVIAQPGEALEATIEVFGASPHKLVAKIDGRDAGPIRNGRLPGVGLTSGRHVISVELLDGNNEVLQRVGHVVRVGAPPRLLAVGLDAAAFEQLAKLAPNFTRKAVEPRELSKALLLESEVVVMPVNVGVRMTSAQSRELAQFVANGGGLYITGDGAAQTNQAYLDNTFRDLLPVSLLNQKQEPPPDNPIKQQDGESDVAAVSMVFVIDRSNSMNATIKGGVTRWQVAVESVKQAMNKLDPWDRAGVLSFTLSQNWQVRPKVIAPFDRELIAKRLLALKTDEQYDKVGYNTDIYKATQEAINVIEQERSAVKVVVVLTDGGDRDNDDGTVRDHHKLAELAISKGINIYALGIGSEFTGADHYSEAAKKVIRGLATKEEFSYIAPDQDAAATAQVVFVRAVEFAYKAYDDKMKEREREKERRPVEPKDPKVDVLEGKFPIEFTPVGRQLFGMRDLPEPAPRLLKYARCRIKPSSALALAFSPPEGEASPVALALRSSGLGRVAFWASGSDASSLGEVAKWEEYPRLVAQTLRWLIPREDPQPRLVGGATTQGIGLLDPIDEASYFLRANGRELAVEQREGVLRALQGELPEGDFEIVERVGTSQRVIGDVFLARVAAVTSRQVPVDNAPALPALVSAPTEISTRREPAVHVAVACLAAMLCLMPLERLVRRRT